MENDQNLEQKVNEDENIDDLLDFDDFDEEEPVDDSNASKDETETDDKKQQSREENHEQAKARRERERVKREQELQDAIEKARKEGYEKALKESNLANNKINTFTEQPIKDEYDLKIFEIQKKIKEEGGDPLNDLPKYLANENRNKVESEKENAEKIEKQKADVRKQVGDFKTNFPTIDHKEILKEGSSFRIYADGKLGGSKSISDLYKEYLTFKESIINEQTNKNKEEEGKVKSSSPTSTTSKVNNARKKVENMSDDEFITYWKNKTGSF